MNLGKFFVQDFKKTHGTSSVVSPTTFSRKLDNFTIDARLVDSDKYSIVLDKLHIQNEDGTNNLDADQLTERAEWLANKLDYLTEALCIVEIDRHNLRAQLRTRRSNDQKSNIVYFQIDLDGTGKSTFERYTYDAIRRERVPSSFHLTEALFIQLINDLTYAVR